MVSGAGGPAQVFMEAGFREPTQLTVREGRWKLISVRSEEDRREMTGSPHELYDVLSDPGRPPDVVERLGGLLRAWYAGGSEPFRERRWIRIRWIPRPGRCCAPWATSSKLRTRQMSGILVLPL